MRKGLTAIMIACACTAGSTTTGFAASVEQEEPADINEMGRRVTIAVEQKIDGYPVSMDFYLDGNTDGDIDLSVESDYGILEIPNLSMEHVMLVRGQDLYVNVNAILSWLKEAASLPEAMLKGVATEPGSYVMIPSLIDGMGELENSLDTWTYGLSGCILGEKDGTIRFDETSLMSAVMILESFVEVNGIELPFEAADILAEEIGRDGFFCEIREAQNGWNGQLILDGEAAPFDISFGPNNFRAVLRDEDGDRIFSLIYIMQEDLYTLQLWGESRDVIMAELRVVENGLYLTVKERGKEVYQCQLQVDFEEFEIQLADPEKTVTFAEYMEQIGAVLGIM